jgi:hypothetical protein
MSEKRDFRKYSAQSPPTRSYFFSLEVYTLRQKCPDSITGSYLRPDTLYCPRGEGLAGPKIDRPYHKDRRVQTIIGEIILHTCPFQQKFSQDSISTSDRNRQIEHSKWQYSSLRGSSHWIFRTGALSTGSTDRRRLFQTPVTEKLLDFPLKR